MYKKRPKISFFAMRCIFLNACVTLVQMPIEPMTEQRKKSSSTLQSLTGSLILPASSTNKCLPIQLDTRNELLLQLLLLLLLDNLLLILSSLATELLTNLHAILITNTNQNTLTACRANSNANVMI
jgi:hypothetical protein